MPDRESFLTGLRERYRQYEETVEELERKRKPGEHDGDRRVEPGAPLYRAEGKAADCRSDA